MKIKKFWPGGHVSLALTLRSATGDVNKIRLETVNAILHCVMLVYQCSHPVFCHMGTPSWFQSGVNCLYLVLPVAPFHVY